jgi:hypothetical protein
MHCPIQCGVSARCPSFNDDGRNKTSDGVDLTGPYYQDGKCTVPHSVKSQGAYRRLTNTEKQVVERTLQAHIIWMHCPSQSVLPVKSQGADRRLTKTAETSDGVDLTCRPISPGWQIALSHSVGSISALSTVYRQGNTSAINSSVDHLAVGCQCCTPPPSAFVDLAMRTPPPTARCPLQTDTQR